MPQAYTTIGSSASPSYSVNTSSVQGTIYYYVVTAVNPSGQSAYSNQVGAISLAGTQGLSLNSAITNAAGTSQTLSFSWTGVTGSNSYTLYQSTTSGQELISGTTICTTSSTSCTAAITLGTPYYYVLVATNSTVSSNTAASSEVTMPYVTSVNPTLTAVSSTQANLDFIPTANLQAPYSVYYYTSSFNGGNATTTGGATQACSYNSSPSSTPAISPTPTGTGTGTGTSTKNISPSGTASQTPTSSNTPSPTVNAGSYSCPVVDTSDQMLYFVVVGTLANGATYQSEEASIPLIGNFSISNIIPSGYSSTYGDRTLQINFPVTSVGGTIYTVSYKLANDVSYTSVPGSFTSSPVTLDFSVNGLNLYPNAMYMFQVTATNNAGTRSNTVSVTSNTPQYFKIPSPIAISFYNTYYLNSLGNLYGWGSYGNDMLLTLGSNQNSPYLLDSSGQWSLVSAGYAGGGSAICVVSIGLVPKCAGFNYLGQVGHGNYSGLFNALSTVLTYGATPSGTGTPALSPSGTSTVSTTASNSPTGLPTMSLSNIVNIVVSPDTTMALDTTQKTWGWGSNIYGQLQYPTLAYQYWAVQGTESYTYLTLGLGLYHGCGLTTSHTVRCWGLSSSGQAGNWNATNITSTAITDANSNVITDFMDLSVGQTNACAIRSDGSVWCWGSSNYGALGSSSANTNVAVPATAFNTNDALSLTSGIAFACVLRKNGQVWCWGNNDTGQLGQSVSSLSWSSSAYQIQTWSDVQTVIAGSYAFHVCAVRQDAGVNTLWCWGRNDTSQLGAGNTPTPGFTPSVTPSMTPSVTPAATVTPSGTPPGAVSVSSTPSNTPTSSIVSSPITTNYQFTPQYVNVPVM
jgi:alpha-tubulin suppressor-like RCC1 family protein